MLFSIFARLPAIWLVFENVCALASITYLTLLFSRQFSYRWLNEKCLHTLNEPTNIIIVLVYFPISFILAFCASNTACLYALCILSTISSCRSERTRSVLFRINNEIMVSFVFPLWSAQPQRFFKRRRWKSWNRDRTPFTIRMLEFMYCTKYTHTRRLKNWNKCAINKWIVFRFCLNYWQTSSNYNRIQMET